MEHDTVPCRRRSHASSRYYRSLTFCHYCPLLRLHPPPLPLSFSPTFPPPRAPPRSTSFSPLLHLLHPLPLPTLMLPLLQKRPSRISLQQPYATASREKDSGEDRITSWASLTCSSSRTLVQRFRILQRSSRPASRPTVPVTASRLPVASG